MTDVVQQLKQLARSDDVSTALAEKLQTLSTRLENPVRVAIVGPPGCGKSSVIDMMLGRNVIAGHSGHPVIAVCFGEREAVFSDQNAQDQPVAAGLLSQTETCSVDERLRQDVPDERLKGYTLLEAAVSPPGSDQNRRFEEVIETAQIILWCSRNFDTVEQSIWQAVPEDKKDHSFLVLTAADKPESLGASTDRLTGLLPRVDEEFLGVFPLATLQALRARSGSTTVDHKRWAASGGQAMHDAVMNQIESGRNADIDLAQQWLTRFGAQVVDKPEPGVERQETRQSTENSDEKEGDLTAPRSRSRRPIHPPNNEFDTAYRLLQIRTERAVEQSHEKRLWSAEEIFTLCHDAIEELSDVFQSVNRESPAVVRARADLDKSRELVTRYQNDKTEDSALNALALMAQLKSEFAINASGSA